MIPVFVELGGTIITQYILIWLDREVSAHWSVSFG